MARGCGYHWGDMGHLVREYPLGQHSIMRMAEGVITPTDPAMPPRVRVIIDQSVFTTSRAAIQEDGRLGLRAEVRAGLKWPGPAPAEEVLAWTGPGGGSVGLGRPPGYIGQPRASRKVRVSPDRSKGS